MKNEFDNNLTDKGWKSMRRLLDREMPEQRRRRRFAWWWFALLLLPLVGAGGWWLLRDSKPVDPAPKMDVPKDSKPVVEAETPLDENTERGETFEKLSNQPSASSAVVGAPSAVVGVPANNKRQSSIPGEKYRATVQPYTQSVVGGDTNNGQNLIPSETSLGENTKPDEIGGKRARVYSSDDLKPSDGVAIGETRQKLPIFGLLEALPVYLQLIENQNKKAIFLTPAVAIQPKITKKQPAQKRWSFGLSASLASENMKTVNGFSAGAAVDWQFARIWGLRSGLHYAQYRLSAEERPVVSLEAAQYADATGNFVSLDTSGGGLNNPVPSVSNPEVLVPVERVRRFEMPVLMYWQPVRPLRIFGGISMNYTFSARASAESFVNSNSYFANTKQAQSNLNELATSRLRRWQTNLQTGLGIRLGKRLELDAFYQYGVPDLKAGTDSGTFDPTTGNAGENLEQRKGATHNFLLNGILFF